MRATFVATLAAILVQPPIFWAWFALPLILGGEQLPLHEFALMGAFVLIFASAFVVVIGIPVFFFLLSHNRANPIAVSGSGFLVAAIPVSVFAWPLRGLSGYSSGGNWHGHYVEFFINGTPTVYGWLNYIEGVLQFGVHGAIGALVFLLVWRQHGPNKAFKRTGYARRLT